MRRSTSTTSWTTVRGRWPPCEPRRRFCPPGVVQGLVQYVRETLEARDLLGDQNEDPSKGRPKAREKRSLLQPVTVPPLAGARTAGIAVPSRRIHPATALKLPRPRMVTGITWRRQRANSRGV